LNLLDTVLQTSSNPLSCIELGGGEGYFASAFKIRFPDSDSYICDISKKHLMNANPNLHKIRGDIRRPYVAAGSMDVVVFWVSLHHLETSDMEIAIKQATDSLRDDGILLIFEPNGLFLPRKLFMRSKFSENVYFDEKEQPIFYEQIVPIASACGLEKIYTTSHNPPYNLYFLKQLKKWPVFYFATEVLYIAERLLSFRFKNFWIDNSGKSRSKRLGLKYGLYVLALFRKRRGDSGK